MRLDRLITLKLARALHLGPARPHPVPILMYHSVSADPEPGVAPYFRTAVSPRRFAEHMEYLRSHGWRVLGLRHGLGAAATSTERLAVLTFDDGFRDFFSTAIPLLRSFGFGATLFLPTDFISERGPPRRFGGRDCATWDQIGQLDYLGLEIGSHTCHHPQLWHLPWPEVDSEIRQSKRTIERHLGGAVTSFSYPFAFPQSDPGFCAGLRARLQRAGYRACVTTEIGRAAVGDDPFRLRRLPVNEEDDIELFQAKLEGAYDWLAGPQRVFKVLRRMFSRPASDLS